MGDAVGSGTAPTESPRGSPWMLVGVLVIGMLAGAAAMVLWRDTDPTPAATISVEPGAETVELWEPVRITPASTDEPPFVMEVVDGSFQVRSSAANTDGNRRELWALDDDHGDVDVTLRIDAPSSLGGSFTPQPGLALRFDDGADGSGTALVIDTNVWSRNFDQLMVGVWSWPASNDTGVDIDQIGEPIQLDERLARIVGAGRNADEPTTDIFGVGPPYDPFSEYGFAEGDLVDVTASDEGFTQRRARIVSVAPRSGLISVERPEAAEPVAFSPVAGTIKFHYADGDAAGADTDGVDPRMLYPRYVRARITESTLQVKSWLVERPEPGWQLTETLPDDVDLPETGRVALVVNHLHGAERHVAFGGLSITPLANP